MVVLGAVLVSTACSHPRGEVMAAPWALARAVDASATVLPLTVYVGSSTCDRFERVDLVEADETVTITARIRSSSSPGGCTSDLRTRSVDVELSEPLGTRELVGCGELPGRPGEPRDCLAPGRSGS